MHDARYFFTHVMKTAGTSFIRYAARNFTPAEMWCVGERIDAQRFPLLHGTVDQLFKAEPELMRRLANTGFRFFEGHMPHAASAALRVPGRPLHCLALLREPVQRVSSHLVFDQRTLARWVLSWRNDRGLDMPMPPESPERLYDDPDWRASVGCNLQVKAFAMTEAEVFKGRNPADAEIDLAVKAVTAPSTEDRVQAAQQLLEKHEQALSRTGSLWHRVLHSFGSTPPLQRVYVVDNEKYERACRVLESIDVIGLTEQLGDFPDVLTWRLGWPKQPMPLVNAASSPQALSPAMRQRISRDNEADIAFYAFARRLVARRRQQRMRRHVLFG